MKQKQVYTQSNKYFKSSWIIYTYHLYIENVVWVSTNRMTLKRRAGKKEKLLELLMTPTKVLFKKFDIMNIRNISLRQVLNFMDQL